MKEGDEFGGVDQGSAIGLILHDWVLLYGEVMILFLFIAIFWPLLILPGLAYLLWTYL
jgi:hypothetical protein